MRACVDAHCWSGAILTPSHTSHFSLDAVDINVGHPNTKVGVSIQIVARGWRKEEMF